MTDQKRTDGIRPWGRPSRHRPPGRTATADTAQGTRTRANLPGPPGRVHTARTLTDTWHAPHSRQFPEHQPGDDQSGGPAESGSG
jgi:hypothetical protein